MIVSNNSTHDKKMSLVVSVLKLAHFFACVALNIALNAISSISTCCLCNDVQETERITRKS